MTTSKISCFCGRDDAWHRSKGLKPIPDRPAKPSRRSASIFPPHIREQFGPALKAMEASRQEANALPEDDALRLEYPMFDGLLAYFPNALAEVSRVSKIGNEQHNPGQPLHWARDKSTDHENKIMRHLADAGRKDKRGVRHSARLAWRSLALLQEELEREEGYPPSRASR